MSFSLSVAIYLICWWIVLFAVLPLKIGPQPEEGARDIHAEASGAPLKPNLPLKFLVTTIVATAVFAVIYAFIAYRVITVDNFPI
jgi:predicted secreted protein